MARRYFKRKTAAGSKVKKEGLSIFKIKFDTLVDKCKNQIIKLNNKIGLIK